jgi:hypothetical protein
MMKMMMMNAYSATLFMGVLLTSYVGLGFLSWLRHALLSLVNLPAVKYQWSKGKFISVFGNIRRMPIYCTW